VDLETEREALYRAITSMDHKNYVTRSQVQCLAALVTQGLVDRSRDNRISVMNYLIGNAVLDSLGINFESFKNMTSDIASLLIDMLMSDEGSWKLSDYGKDLISEAESTVKAYARV